ncbi:MAG: bacterial Ig-like domain-containing protein [Enterococcus lacertideformus]|uniref:Bacterial Ig-like domain-containing protein n=1 Tax=Enterococcus lacertideformus TaxID=2771493 RepID=A0A931AT24_9ENTE|nr:bacterial Ig-like domain-containing protein [Enterococcus lacertideformus]
MGNIKITITGKTIDETISNKVYEIANASFEVPDHTEPGKEYTINYWNMHSLSFSNSSGGLIPLSESGITLDLNATKVIDETGKDWTAFFNLQENGSSRLTSFPEEFYGHTYTIKFFGSIEHPKNYSNYIKDGYVCFPNIYFRLSSTQSGYNSITGDYFFRTDQYIKFLVYTVDANYIDENNNKLIDSIVYGGYSGDTYQTLPKEIPGYHLIETVGNPNGEFTKEPITVNYVYRQDLYTINARDSTIYVGENWQPEDNFISATNIDGQAISFEDPAISIEGSVDTATPGVYPVIYKNHTAQKKITVTVKKRPLILKVPDTVNFGRIKLGSQALLFWPSENIVAVQDEANTSWNLSVKLASTTLPDFANFIKFNGNTLSAEVQPIASGTGNTIVSNQNQNETFIYVDYTQATALRADQAVLEWTLTPSTKGVME